MTKLLTTGTLTSALSADEIARLLGRSLPRAERKRAVRKQLVELLREHDGKPEWWTIVARDETLLDLANQEKYSREHIYAMRLQAIRDGDYVAPPR